MESKVVKYPIGQQSFELLREGGYLYVDKTRYLETIVNGSQYYFLGRPRRFGKSLLLSMLKSFYEGRRDLFKGLYADTMKWDWQPHPVLYLDLNTQKYQDAGNLRDIIEDFLLKEEEKYDIVPKIANHSVRFSNLIRIAAERSGRPVVILVDEYDKPMVNNMHNPERFEMFRDDLAAFYSNFKSSADYIQLVFLTGVTRFGKLSVFSSLNNLKDISFVNKFAGICGITEEEMLAYFKEGIGQLTSVSGRTREEELKRIKEHYDGYHFTADCPDIYNPFSLLNLFDNLSYANYWISSGTPSLLVEQLKRTHANLKQLFEARCSESTLSGLDALNIIPESLLYQSGYLTLKEYDPDGKFYYLGLPNEEVTEGFFQYLLPFYSSIHRKEADIFVFDLRREIEQGQTEEFMRRLQSFFAGISYEMKMSEEVNVQNALLILFTLLGLSVNVEYRTSDGRIDILMRTDRYIYIFELKFDGSADDAIAQIERKEYARPWACESRRIIAIGANYSTTSRRLDSWIIRDID